MTRDKLNELHKKIEEGLHEFQKGLDHESSEYKILKSNFTTILKEINELRIKSITENGDTRIHTNRD